MDKYRDGAQAILDRLEQEVGQMLDLRQQTPTPRGKTLTPPSPIWDTPEPDIATQIPDEPAQLGDAADAGETSPVHASYTAPASMQGSAPVALSFNF